MAKCILIIDNTKANLEFLHYLLTASGYEVASAETVTEGLSFLRKYIPPDLIISDLNIPERDGFDLLKAVKADSALKEIPFIILSSTSHSWQDVDMALELGAAKFIHRPIEPQLLLLEIDPYLPDLPVEQQERGTA